MKDSKRRGPIKIKGPPNQLETTNLVEHEAPTFCGACNDFHESTCPRFIQINEAMLAEMNNYVGHSRYSNQINVHGKNSSCIHGSLGFKQWKEVRIQRM
jgi:hypothetical protein